MRPESGVRTDETRGPVHAVGIGPGDLDYLTPKGRHVLATADVVLGFETVVAYVTSLTDADRLTCSYDDEAEVLDRFADRIVDGAAGAVVMMGDPNVSGHQFLDKVDRAVDHPISVIPGISSIQVAMSRVRIPFEESTFVTLHKRGPLDGELGRLAADVGDHDLLVLPRPYDWMPGDVAAYLIDTGAPASLDAIVLERLTHDDESVTHNTLADLAQDAGGAGPDDTPFSDLSVLVVRQTR